MFVLSSPSGAGKTSISRRLLERHQDISLSVSVTTRAPRPGEVDGVHYHFIDRPAFERMAANGDLLEHAEVFGRHYGTPRGPVEAALADGRDVLFDIDWQGTQQLAENARDDLVAVFILPPTAAELERRLRTRAQDSDEEIARRMSKAAGEMSHWPEYDYVIVNADFETSVAQTDAILTAERLRRRRLIGLGDFVRSLSQPG
jgi:guanylate kinase